VEFVLLDYASTDGLAQWVQRELAEYLASGLVVFYQVLGLMAWRVCHAKNIAHRLASGAITCNLDADNFTGPDFARVLSDAFSGDERSFLRASSPNGDHGRLAFRKEDFLALGGYDERFIYGWGYDDTDLIARAKSWGLKERFLPRPRISAQFIPHTDAERVCNSVEKDKAESRQRHRRLSLKSLRASQFVANPGLCWGRAAVVRNFTTPIDSWMYPQPCEPLEKEHEPCLVQDRF